MKKYLASRQNSSAASTLQITLALALLSLSAIFFAPSVKAAASGTMITVPQTTITVSLPIDTLDYSNANVILKPVTTTTIASSLDYFGFQGDFTYDSSVVRLVTPYVEAAGLTANNYTIIGDILGGGTIKTLRFSAFSMDTPLIGSGTLFNVRMLRVSSTPCDMSQLVWSPVPDNFFFIAANLTTFDPTVSNGLITIAAPGTWSAHPGSNDWNTASNWLSTTVPNGPAATATFAVSDTINVSITADTVVDGIVFGSCASAPFGISIRPALSLTISGAGIMNNSGFDQTISNDGGVTIGAPGGRTLFEGTSNADDATLIANGGSNGGLGGTIEFVADATGGTARVEIFDNGFLDISSHNAPGVTIGSLEGNENGVFGNVFLGSNNLTIGSLDISTSFSGVIHDGAPLGGGGSGGSLTKTGMGTLTLSGANTYTGPTQISEGKLKVEGSIGTIGQLVTVSTGGTLSGAGVVSGTVVNAGGILWPGDPQTLTVDGNYQQHGGAKLRLSIAGTGAGTFDRLVVLGGITLLTGSVLELDFIDGFAPQAGDTFDLVAYGSLTGTFSTINIEGLEPGFQYTLAADGGNLRLTASNDGVPTLINISGTISYCSNPALPPVPGVTLNLTPGTPAMSDGSGNYQLLSLVSGGSYTVTPTKAALTPGSTGINTVDVLAVQKHFLNTGPPLSGCRLAAADVNGNTAVNTADVIAIQRFALGLSFGLANTGKWTFTPASRSYTGLTSNQTAQNYDTVVLGDVIGTFVNPARPEGASQDAAGGDDQVGNEVAATVAAIALPEIAVDQLRTPKAFASGLLSRVEAKSSFTAAVRTSAIDANSKLVGFQGDFTFDERVVTFESEPVQNAGLTAGNWNVSGNVLDGTGPIRTVRVSAYSNDFTPLSGSGTLFELRMTRVSKAARGTPLLWAAPPDQFIFIDADLNTQKPGHAAPGSVTISGKR